MHFGFLATHEADCLLDCARDVEPRVVHEGTDRRDMDSLSIANHALTVFIDEYVYVDRHKLGLEEISQLAAQLLLLLSEVYALW